MLPAPYRRPVLKLFIRRWMRWQRISLSEGMAPNKVIDFYEKR